MEQPEGIFICKVTESNEWRAVTAKRRGERVEGRAGMDVGPAGNKLLFSKKESKRYFKRLTFLIENNTKFEHYPQKELTYFKI